MSEQAITLEYLNEERRQAWDRITKAEARNVELARKIEDLRDLITKNPEQLKIVLAGYAKKADAHLETAGNAAAHVEEALARVTADHADLVAKISQLDAQLGGVAVAEKDVMGMRDRLAEEMKSTETLMETVRKWKDEFDDLISEVSERTAEADEASELLKKVKTVQAQLLSYSKSADEYHDAIQEAHDEIFGATVEINGTESVSPGLKAKLDESYKELRRDLDGATAKLNELLTNSKTRSEEVEREWQSRHQAIHTELKTLLPDALSAGLSAAYNKKREAEESVERVAARSFLGCVIVMSLIALIPFVAGFLHAHSEGGAKEGLVDYALKLAPLTLPLYLPALWFAHAASKRRSLAKRLVEEYAHKETLSKTYQALSEQVAAIKDGKMAEELRTRLLFNLLEVNSENPGKLISDYGKADHPLLDALDKSVKLANAVERLGKLPGFGALAAKMHAKSERIQKRQAVKAAEGFDAMGEAGGE